MRTDVAGSRDERSCDRDRYACGVSASILVARCRRLGRFWFVRVPHYAWRSTLDFVGVDRHWAQGAALAAVGVVVIAIWKRGSKDDTSIADYVFGAVIPAAAWFVVVFAFAYAHAPLTIADRVAGQRARARRTLSKFHGDRVGEAMLKLERDVFVRHTQDPSRVVNGMQFLFEHDALLAIGVQGELLGMFVEDKLGLKRGAIPEGHCEILLGRMVVIGVVDTQQRVHKNTGYHYTAFVLTPLGRDVLRRHERLRNPPRRVITQSLPLRS